jgi:hypothetical protein
VLALSRSRLTGVLVALLLALTGPFSADAAVPAGDGDDRDLVGQAVCTVLATATAPCGPFER